MPADQPVQVPTPKPGDFIWYGRFRNRPAIVTKVFVDDKGAAKYEFEPVPKGRKKSKVRNLLPYKAMSPEDSAKYKAIYDEETRKMREKKACDQATALRVAARHQRAYAPNLWPKAVAAIRRYEALYQEAMALKDPLTDEGRTSLKQFDLGNVDAWPRQPANDFGAWVDQCYSGQLSGYSSMGPHPVLNGRMSLADYQATTLKPEHDAVQGILDTVGPERFVYKGFKIYNPERMTDSLCVPVLEAIDYVVALFKKRGVSLDLLRKGLAAIYIEPRVTGMSGKNPAGTYLWGVIQLSATALRSKGTLLERFMNEVFLHEFGHHVHEHVLPKEAKAAWDAPWDAHDEVQSQVKTLYMQTTAKERARWFALLEKTKFDVSKAAARLKGLEKLKFGAWLRQDMWKNPLIKPKRFQLTERGEAVFGLLRRFQEDPDKAARDEFIGISYSPAELKERADSIVETYKGWLGVGPHWNHNVDLEPALVQQLADADPAMGEALEKAKSDLAALKGTLVTDYARTNKQEDFAESFVAFMGAPSKLTPETKFRMQRTLSLAGLYGKPVMRLGAVEAVPVSLMPDKTSKTMVTLDSPAIEQLRKDLLALMKNIPRVDTYAKGDKLRDAFKVFRNNFDTVFFKHFLNHDLRYSDDVSEGDKQYLDKKLRKIGWDLYIELTLPLPYENDHYTQGMALQKFKEDSTKWANRVKAKARAFWSAMDEAIAYYTQMTSKPGFNVELPTEERVSMEGFDVYVIGYQYGDYGGDRIDDLIAKFRAGLKHFKVRAGQVLPLMLKAMLPLHLIAYHRKIDEGGMYHGSYIEIAAFGFTEFQNKNQMAQVIAHEMGHHLYKHYLSKPDREFWDTAVRGNYGPMDLEKALRLWPTHKEVWAFEMVDYLKDIDPVLAVQISLIGWGHGTGAHRGPQSREEFEKLYKDGGQVSVPQNPISGYAGKNSEEAFCEAVGNLIGYGSRTVDPLVQSWLKMILPSIRIAAQTDTLALKVAARHQAAEVTLAELQNVAEEFGVGINLPQAGQKFSWDDNDSLADALLDDDTSLSPDMLPAVKVAARYQEKKKVPKANGKGTTEVYVYSEKQVEHRNREKAKRLQKFKPKVEKLRAKVKKDLESEDRKTRLTATAVGLIDETHERVGNDESAKGERNDSGEPHYGVTGWKKKHVSLGSASATIKYVGKSGVKQEKTVSTPHILKALRRAYNETEGKDGCLFSWEDGSVSGAEVNEYLKPFDISAKDLRGLAANSIMQRALKKHRKGKLPGDKKEREEKLKEEFKLALDEVSDELGHEASTLKSQYLAPNMEREYLKDGTIIEKLDD